MHAVTIGYQNFNDIDISGRMSSSPPASTNNPVSWDPSHIQHLMNLVNSPSPPVTSPQSVSTAPSLSLTAAAPKQTAVVECPKSMVGRVIGKGGETIKALQQYSGAMIQIDQSTDPTRVTISGNAQSLQLAVSMVSDIVRGTFKGFAMLRQIAVASGPSAIPTGPQQPTPPSTDPHPIYVQGYGFVPPSQSLTGQEEGFLRSSPTGPITPPITPSLRAPGTTGGETGSIAALLSPQQDVPVSFQQQQQQQQQQHDALIVQLFSQLAMQQRGVPSHHHHHQQHATTYSPQANPPSSTGAAATSGMDQAAIQTMLATAGLLGLAGQGPIGASNFPPSSNVRLSAHGGAPAVLGSLSGEDQGLHAYHPINYPPPPQQHFYHHQQQQQHHAAGSPSYLFGQAPSSWTPGSVSPLANNSGRASPAAHPLHDREASYTNRYDNNSGIGNTSPHGSRDGSEGANNNEGGKKASCLAEKGNSSSNPLSPPTFDTSSSSASLLASAEPFLSQNTTSMGLRYASSNIDGNSPYGGGVHGAAW